MKRLSLLFHLPLILILLLISLYPSLPFLVLSLSIFFIYSSSIADIPFPMLPSSLQLCLCPYFMFHTQMSYLIYSLFCFFFFLWFPFFPCILPFELLLPVSI